VITIGNIKLTLLSLWALSGWTILADLYDDFADKSDIWFSKLIGRKGGAGTSGTGNASGAATSSADTSSGDTPSANTPSADSSGSGTS